jgi:hypothetical protein
MAGAGVGVVPAKIGAAVSMSRVVAFMVVAFHRARGLPDWELGVSSGLNPVSPGNALSSSILAENREVMRFREWLGGK